jgi:hypothetical protein
MRSLSARLTLTVVLLLALVLPTTAPQPATAQTTTAEAPTFSVQRGFYTSAFNLTLSSPGASIRYTLDGSTPTQFVGQVYSGPIAVSTTTSVRAIAYSQTLAPSPVATHSYIFLADVRAQSDTALPGWPINFAATDLNGSYPADYGMDPDVTGHPNNSTKFDTVMKALPTLSLVTDLPNLWSPATGIYYRPNAKGNSPIDPAGTMWERPMSIEWINPDGTTGFSQLAGASIDGETSRRPHRQPKKNFRIAFSGTYGTAGLDFELFDSGDPVASFDEIILRNGGNRSWSYFDRDQRRIADYVNDEWSRRAWGRMGNLEVHGTYVHLYLNGLYWGLYNVSENLDPEFLQSYLGLTSADYDIIQAGDDAGNFPVAKAGTTVAWNEVIGLVSGTDPVSNTLYQDVAARVDVVNLADYFVHAHYIGKTDWPHHNWNAYRQNTGPDTRFRFTPLENDTSLNKLTENTTLLTDSVGLADAPVQVFLRLTTNAEFRQVLADRLYKHVADPVGALSPTNCAALYTELTDIIDQAVIGESARWGDYMRDKYPPTNAAPKGFPAYLHSRDLPTAYTDPANAVLDTEQRTWLEIRNEKLASYCPNRSTNVVNQYTTNGWYSTAVRAPGFSQRGGMVSGGSITINNTPNSNAGAIYYTTNGVDPRAPFGAIAGGATLGNDSVNVSITQVTTVKARVLNGSTWSPLAEYTFYPAQAFENLVINEIHYNPIAPVSPAGQNPNDFEFVELHNKGATPLRLDDVSFKSGILFRFPANTTLAPGQFLVLASDSASFQSRYGFAPFGAYQGSLVNQGESLELIDPIGTLIDGVEYQAIAPWPLGANGGGGSLSLSSPTANNSVATNWYASTINGGTPGIANNSSPAGLTVPQISWTEPAAITYGTPLGAGQLAAAVTDGGNPVAGTFSYTPAPGTILNAGNDQVLRVIFTPNDASTYAGVNITVLIDVIKAPLTITANNKVKRVGTANPALTATYSGFVNGDDVTVLDTPAALSTTATTGSPVGDYPITVSGAADNNYNISFVEGTLTITQKGVPVINWANPATITYGTPIGAQLNATASENAQSVAGTFSYTPAAGTILQAGNDQTLSVTFTPADTDAYVSVTHQVTIDVAKAPLRIKAENKVKQVGTANPPLTATYTGFVNGDDVADLDVPVVLSTTATTASPVAIYPITVSGASDSNYNMIFVNGTLTVVTDPVQETEYRMMLPMIFVK